MSKHTPEVARQLREKNKLRGLYIGRPKIDLTGKRFGWLTVLNYVGSRWHASIWNCKCDCGKTKVVFGGPLRDGRTTSCGCQNSRLRKGANSGSWKGCGEIAGAYMTFIKHGANGNGRSLSVEITAEDLSSQFNAQNGLCALTGMQLTLRGSNGKNGTASVDRIDSKKGYLPDNIQWVHKDVNRMKSNFDQDYFQHLCKLVVQRKEASASRN